MRQGSDLQAQCLAAPQSPLPTYKQRYDEFRKLFKELPETEILLVGECQQLPVDSTKLNWFQGDSEHKTHVLG